MDFLVKARRAGAWLPIVVFVGALALISCGGGGGGGSSSTGVTGASTGQTASTTGTTTGNGPLGCALDLFSPNYCEETDPGSDEPNTIHWWDHFPLKVYFTSDPTIQGQQLSTVCLAGFNAWASVAGENVAVQVGTEGEADVVITFQNLASIPGGGQWIGQASWSYNPITREVGSADITLRTWDGMTLAEVADGLRRTAQHEYGHVLFMGGHSEAGADTMFPSGPVDVYTALTTRDQNSLNTAYCGSFADRAPGRAPKGLFVRQTVDCPR